MFVERYLERRFQEGKVRGEKNNQKLWEAWNRRRLEAAARSEPFNEPTPSLDMEDAE